MLIGFSHGGGGPSIDAGINNEAGVFAFRRRSSEPNSRALRIVRVWTFRMWFPYRVAPYEMPRNFCVPLQK